MIMMLNCIALGCFFLRISYYDIKFRIIYNQDVLIILVLSVIYVLLGKWASGHWIWHFLAFLVTLTPSLLLFAFGIWGGGDAKLLIAVSPIAELQTLLLFYFMISIAGLLQSISVVSIRYLMSHQKFRPGMPYGVAICGGSMMYLLLDLFFR